MALRLDGVNTVPDMDTVIQTAAYYGVEDPENQAVHMIHIVQSHYRELAASYSIPEKENHAMTKVFEYGKK